MDPSELAGQKLALIMTNHSDEGEDETAVFTRTALWDGVELSVLPSEDAKPFIIPEDWYSRIKPVRDEEIRSILLGANYCVWLHGSSIPGILPEEERTGFKWPTSEPASES